MMDQLWRDLRYGLRTLGRSPGFTAVAVLTLGLGIGANTAIFSVVNAVLLRPLPYEEPSSLVQVTEVHPEGTPNTVSFPNFTDWVKSGEPFRSLAVYRDISFSLAGRGDPERVTGALVSANFFGARRTEIVRLVVGESMATVGIGIIVGVAAAASLSRFIASLLYAVRPDDPLTFLAISGLIAAVALAASLVPARRAVRVDPMRALRSE